MDEIRPPQTLTAAQLLELRTNPRNRNKGTDAGQLLLEKSMRRVKYTRPAFAAANGVILGGNHAHKTVEKLRGEGQFTKPPIVVETEGDQEVIHVRKDWADENHPDAVLAGVLDNETQRQNYVADREGVAEDLEEIDESPEAVGMSEAELDEEPGEGEGEGRGEGLLRPLRPAASEASESGEKPATYGGEGNGGTDGEGGGADTAGKSKADKGRKMIPEACCLLVECEDEKEQRRVWNKLVELGLNVRPMNRF